MNEHAPWTELDLVVIDVEGDGQQPPDLVEFAAVPITGGIIGEPRSWLVRPQTKITWQARKVHGISDADVADQPGFDAIADEVRHELGDVLPAGHNVRVDLGVMTRKLPDWSPAEAFDTLRMARAAWSLPSYKLSALVEHRATYDALVTARLLVDLASHSGPQPWTIAELRRHGGIALTTGQTEESAEQPGLFNAPERA